MEASSVLIFIGWVFFEAQFCYFPQNKINRRGKYVLRPSYVYLKGVWFK